jgi:hypothetical protein
MRAIITVEHQRSNDESLHVGQPAVDLLETLPGISEVRVEHEDRLRAVISYRWRDPGVHFPSLSATFLSHGMRLL